MQEYKLIILDGDDEDREVSIPLLLSIGRQKNNDLILQNPAVSREHARILHFSDGLFIEDLGSSHGTAVNGKKIRLQKIIPGDIITVGPVSLKLEENFKELDEQSIRIVHSESTENTEYNPANFNKRDIRSSNYILNAALQFISLSDCNKAGEILAVLLTELLNSERCAVYFRENNEIPVFEINNSESKEESIFFKFSGSILKRILENKEVLIVTEDIRSPSRKKKTAIASPIWGNSQVVGAVIIQNNNNEEFDKNDIKPVITLCTLAGAAIEKIK